MKTSQIKLLEGILTMNVKTGDIVRYGGKTQRLMMCGTHILRLSHDGNIGGSPSNLELVESVTLPN